MSFLSKVNYAISNAIVTATYDISYSIYTISNAIVIATYDISYSIYTILTLIPLYSSVKIRLVEVNYKKKSVPLQACSGPEGSRNLRFPDFMTTAQDGDKVVSLMHRPPLPPGNTAGTHLC